MSAEKLKAADAMPVWMLVKREDGSETHAYVTEGYYSDGDREAGLVTRFERGDIVPYGEHAGAQILQPNAEVCHCAACQGYN